MRVLAPPSTHRIVVELDVFTELDGLRSDDEVVEVGLLQGDFEDVFQDLRITHELVFNGRVPSSREALVERQEREPSPQRVSFVGELGQVVEALDHDSARSPLDGTLVLPVDRDDLVGDVLLQVARCLSENAHRVLISKHRRLTEERLRAEPVRELLEGHRGPVTSTYELLQEHEQCALAALTLRRVEADRLVVVFMNPKGSCDRLPDERDPFHIAREEVRQPRVELPGRAVLQRADRGDSIRVVGGHALGQVHAIWRERFERASLNVVDAVTHRDEVRLRALGDHRRERTQLRVDLVHEIRVRGFRVRTQKVAHPLALSDLAIRALEAA